MIELYNDINEIWLHNWEQLSLSGKWEWMIKDYAKYNENQYIVKRYQSKNILIRWFYKWRINKYYKSHPTAQDIENSYLSLNDQFSDLTGDKSKIEEWQSLVILRMEARLNYANGDLSQINWIEKYDGMINALMKSSENVDMIQSRLQYAQAYGMNINSREITVGDFIRIVRIVDAQERKKIKNKA